MPNKTKLQLSKTVRIRKVHGEALLLDLKSQACFGLDEIGIAVWEGVAAHGDPDLIIEALLSEYDVDRETLANDVHSLVEDMLKRGLLINGDQTPR